MSASASVRATEGRHAVSLPFRLLNTGGRVLSTLGFSPVGLDERSLLDAARASTKLDDFGDEGFKVGMSALLESLREEAELTLLGRLIARTEILMYLENRLRMADWRRRHPEISRGKIARPIFVIGMARTGTTILHDLLAQDPANRVPLSWEVDRPCPPPQTATYRSDPRIAAVQKTIDRSESIIADFKRMHPMGAELPQECVRMTATEFASMIFQTTYYVPSYVRWLHGSADIAAAYKAHRRMLQLLQWRCPAERWVLKSPAHLWTLEQLLAEYPDACLVQTHRDPLKVISSLTSLVTVLRLMASDRSDPAATAREWSDTIMDALDRSVVSRERGLIPAAQVIDIQFREFLADPLAAVARIYAHFDMELTAEAEQRMRSFMAANPDDKHGKHVHAFADTGLDIEEERAKAKSYQDYFDVASERSL